MKIQAINVLFRIIAAALLLVLVCEEVPCYRAELLLAGADGRLSDALHGVTRGELAVESTNLALMQARQASTLLPDDDRATLAQAVALLLVHRGGDAIAVLTPAIARGERPELTLNLGRARGISNDAAGAQRAFLHTAWASPASIATLPASMRGPLLNEVKAMETELHGGRLTAPPPW